MEFLKITYLALILPILGVFLAFCTPVKGMDTMYSNKVKINPSWIQVAMNDGRSASIPSNSSHSTTFWTDGLKGCVVTLLKLEYNDGKRMAAMCHFSHDKKMHNKEYIQTMLSGIDQHTIKIAECIIIAPGISSSGTLKPIIDPIWKQMIVHAIRTALPMATIDTETYLFNTESSSVIYTLGKKSPIHIINLSQEEDLINQDLLLICHEHKKQSLCQRIAPVVAALTLLTGYLAYQLS